MKNILLLFGLILFTGSALAQGPRPTDIAASPQPVGDAGVMWYTTWDTALAEAKRSNRPIFFMAAAATCSGISGVF
ncbi:thioredoxin family protein [Verrucomicrobiales bacterium]|nr:thioredoxin family protein [Verrucomicrobiales bacterium]MDB3941371.1 thioredoxin family protein [Verrucomicrobiales bacterium]